MRPIYLLLITIVLTFALSGCSDSQQASIEQGNLVQERLVQDTLFQYSTLSSLLEGVYDGAVTFGDLKSHGDFGLGTFNALDGEMVTVDGQAYQIKANGVAYLVDDEMKSPFAVLTFFDVDESTTIDEPLDCTQLGAHIDTLLPTENIPFALKVEGSFKYLKTRSVPRQEEPYPKLVDVVANQPTFEFNDTPGVMVGFRLPDYMGDTNAPGYHFHFITEDRTAGGHVLECLLEKVTVEIDYTDEWHIELPADNDFYTVDLSETE